MSDLSPNHPPATNPRAVSLRLIGVFITCLAIAFGLIWHWPGGGPILAVGLIIAVARMWSMMRMVVPGGRVADWKTWGLSFVGSVGVIGLAATAASGAFFSVCFPIGVSQFNYAQAQETIFARSGWLMGGMAGALIAALVLDRVWLHPLAAAGTGQGVPSLKERTRGLYRACTFPLAVIVCGGLASLIPAAVAVFSGPSRPGTAMIAYLSCVAAFIGGASVGLLAARHFPVSMAGFLGFVIATVTIALLMLLLDDVLAGRFPLPPTGRIIVAMTIGSGAGAVTALIARWSNELD